MTGQFDRKFVYLIIHKKQNKALQVPTIHTQFQKADVELGPINQQNPKQLWIVQYKEAGFIQLVSGFPDKVLSADGNNVNIKKGQGHKTQYWRIDNTVYGKIRILNGKQTDKFLCYDSFFKKVVLKKGIPIQIADDWEFRKVLKNQDLNKTCFIYCPFSQKMIDVPSSSTDQLVQICMWQPNYRFNQRWRLYKAGEVYIIKSYKTQLNLDIYRNNYQDGEKVIQFHSNGGSNQFWKLQKLQNTNDSFRICSFEEPQFQLGHDGKKLCIYKGKKFIWRIEGHIPQ